LGLCKWLEQFVDGLAEGLQEASTAGADGSALDRATRFVDLHGEVQVGVWVGATLFKLFGHVFLALGVDKVGMFIDPVFDGDSDLTNAHGGSEGGEQLIGVAVIQVISEGSADVCCLFDNSGA